MNIPIEARSKAPGVDRRSFLVSAATVSAALASWQWRSALAAGRDATNPAGAAEQPKGLIVRQKGPENLEFPFDTLDGPITPNETFYVRNHFAVPKIDTSAW